MKRPLLISIACVAAALALLFWGFGQTPTTPEQARSRYVLLIENDTGTFLLQLRKGLEKAAAELHVTFSVMPVSELPRAGAVNACLLLLNEPEATLDTLAGMKIPAVVIGREVEGVPCVLSDHPDTGSQLIRRALEEADASRIALIMDKADPSAAARSRAATLWAKRNGILVLQYSPLLILPSDCEAAIATSERSTQWLAEQKQQAQFDGFVLGVDTGETRVSDLESGSVQVMALENPFAMGYVAMQQAHEALQGKVHDPTRIKSLLAELQNMYLAENVKLVFPLLQ